ncbi:hypothetical protein NOF55_17065 [Rhizobiaceae bacterium BDR2-2]|uniref:Uncharacterized protein n=1 Tax=Ectorhizobium quercum TaxID=2965071 RepID=A0AAE3N267_9HYPH|nr:hypothetical protein [Ectorhizobium quercum]MCX8996135.1 hypothetical protein [Ectorhizobium quercum]MCX8998826.1 hypothetical protein [Ectorhizobium quercum]
MLKLLLTGIWVCLVTLGAVWFSIGQATAPVQGDTGPRIDTELLRGETTTIPLIADGSVQGYFLSRVSLIVDKAKIGETKLPMKELVTDSLFTLLVGNPVVDVAHVERFDLAAFKSRIKDGLNDRFGDGIVSDVLVEQLDYLSKDDIRINTNAQRSVRPGLQITPGEAVADPAPAGH